MRGLNTTHHIRTKNALILGFVRPSPSTISFLLLGINVGIGFIHILIATAIAGCGHVLGIVAYAIAATSGLTGTPNRASPVASPD
jgi:hypothetical protein